jgi:hypothetical protein
MKPVSVLTGIVGEFHEGEKFGPDFWVNRTENGQVSFDFLVDPFGCSIGLGMKRG